MRIAKLFFPTLLLVSWVIWNDAIAVPLECSGIVSVAQARTANRPISIRIIDGPKKGAVVNVRLSKGQTVTGLQAGEIVKSYGMRFRVVAVERVPCGYKVTASKL